MGNEFPSPMEDFELEESEFPPLEESPIYGYIYNWLMDAEKCNDENISKLIRKIRETWGYDLVDDDDVPCNWPLSPVDMSNKYARDLYYEEAVMAANVALRTINSELEETYELVDLKNVVATSFEVLLLTFTARETGAHDAKQITFQAMVYVDHFYNRQEVDDWRIKETSS